MAYPDEIGTPVNPTHCLACLDDGDTGGKDCECCYCIRDNVDDFFKDDSE